jgi:hypothetical protein
MDTDKIMKKIYAVAVLLFAASACLFGQTAEGVIALLYDAVAEEKEVNNFAK